MHTPKVQLFMTAISQGNWEAVIENIECLGIVDNNKLSTVKFLVFEQKYLEQLEKQDIKSALHCLRFELTPLNIFHDKIQQLSTLLMCTNTSDLYKHSNWSGYNNSKYELLNKIQQYVDVSILFEYSRLKELLLCSIKYQIDNCMYHVTNGEKDKITLLSKHKCSKETVPTNTSEILEEHTDEVWFLSYSNNGLYLASGSKDNSIILWKVIDNNNNNNNNNNISNNNKKHVYWQKITGHNGPISYLSWSPNDNYLLSCSTSTSNNSNNSNNGNNNNNSENVIKMWKINENCTVSEITITKHSEPVTSCVWLPDNNRFISGGLDKHIYMWDIYGNEIEHWNIPRVNDLVLNNDGTSLFVVCQDKKIRIIDIDNKTEEQIIETDSPTSIQISKSNKYLLVNLSSHEIHLWDIEKQQLIQKYKGLKQSRFVIRSCFGGSNENFVVSGSEDSNIYIWHRLHGNLLHTLTGHSGTVNCVTWCPSNLSNNNMFASGSDDHTIRIWTAAQPLK